MKRIIILILSILTVNLTAQELKNYELFNLTTVHQNIHIIIL